MGCSGSKVQRDLYSLGSQQHQEVTWPEMGDSMGHNRRSEIDDGKGSERTEESGDKHQLQVLIWST